MLLVEPRLDNKVFFFGGGGGDINARMRVPSSGDNM